MGFGVNERNRDFSPNDLLGHDIGAISRYLLQLLNRKEQLVRCTLRSVFP